MKFLKCQYGLKQAGREWHLPLVTELVEKIGMEQCQTEPRVFRKIIKNEVSLMAGVRVDDIMLNIKSRGPTPYRVKYWYGRWSESTTEISSLLLTEI